MKSKKAASSRRRISFAVDRDEIEVNSDWVEAVMAAPNRPAAELPASPPPEPAPETLEAPFFAPDPNTATDEVSASGAQCGPVECLGSVVDSAPVANDEAVVDIAPVVQGAPVEALATVTGHSPVAVFAQTTEPTNTATDQHLATGEVLITGTRTWRPRPIRRITDGLTPGQYTVYQLMHEAAEGAGESTRVYTGGYADLRRLTGLSKRGIQNIVAELQSKQVLRIHQRPGYHRTQTTAYAIPDAEDVLQIWAAHGWRNAVGKSKTLTG